jgi:hypothetical protein
MLKCQCSLQICQFVYNCAVYLFIIFVCSFSVEKVNSVIHGILILFVLLGWEKQMV